MHVRSVIPFFLMSMLSVTACARSQAVGLPGTPVLSCVDDPNRYAPPKVDCHILDEESRVVNRSEWLLNPSCKGPPSKIHTEAWRLYDEGFRTNAGLTTYEKSHLESAVGLTDQILAGETKDDDCYVQRTRFLRGKVHYRLGRYREAHDDFTIVLCNGGHRYYRAALPWMQATKIRLK